MKRVATSLILILAGGCEPARVPPGNLSVEGLPVTGSLAFAQRAGFTRCLDFNSYLRCRRDGIYLAGEGPYQGAIDARGADGGGGFDQLTLWHERDQRAVVAVARKLAVSGWRLCRTQIDDRGDQNIWRKAGSKVRVSIDVSYWGKRRLRVLPELGQATGKCL
ncbi:hypothetical protein M9978_15535 [Sphingomonas sp. MG17]|uniref:Lipoprotein n=1 Tax=Sphingomonas tagetis TaxID=2949092 RepID=A0A9X2HKM5_9SPHN|nr:hypothetical protein [Sphingomonas tagetis]MCP3731837.1 hypothetical protein [Sphingomonas tagetis]